MENYGEIVRGSRWPAGDDSLTVTLTKSSGWPAGAASWTWKLLLSQNRSGGSPDLELTAASATISGTSLTLVFHATDEQTATLTGSGKTRCWVDLQSDNAGDIGVWPAAAGYVIVRDAVGEGA